MLGNGSLCEDFKRCFEENAELETFQRIMKRWQRGSIDLQDAPAESFA